MTINTRKVFKIYQSLDKEQIQVVLEKRMEGSYGIDDWLKRLYRLAVMDSIGDDTRQRSGNLSITFGVFTVFTIILTITKPFLFFFPLGFFIIFSYFIFNYYTLSKLDIGNHLRLFIVPVLERLQDENIVDGQLFLRLDLSMPDSREKLVQTIEEQDNSKIFKHHWMNGELKFRDGIKVTWEIEDVVKKVQKKFQGMASKMDLTSKIYMDLTSNIKNIIFVDHLLKMRFLAPVDSFQSLEKDTRKTEDGRFFVYELNQSDTSGNFEEGMDPKAFFAAIENGYQKVKPINTVNT